MTAQEVATQREHMSIAQFLGRTGMLYTSYINVLQLTNFGISCTLRIVDINGK